MEGSFVVFLFAIGVLILNIAMIVKFFQIASDVNNIRKAVSIEKNYFTRANALALRLSGKADEGLDRAIMSMTKELEEKFCGRGEKSPTEIVSFYNEWTTTLGRTLPKELQSVEAYVEFAKNIL